MDHCETFGDHATQWDYDQYMMSPGAKRRSD